MGPSWEYAHLPVSQPAMRCARCDVEIELGSEFCTPCLAVVSSPARNAIVPHPLDAPNNAALAECAPRGSAIDSTK